MSEWITDWSKINDGVIYIVCPINARPVSGSLYLGHSIGQRMGREVKRLMPGCYAALVCPPFPPQRHREAK